jgi:hypothetical protein
MAQGNTGSVVPVTKNGAPTLLFAVGIALLPLTTHVWDGTVEYGTSVEIESGNLVPPGNRIEVYHLERGYGPIPSRASNGTAAPLNWKFITTKLESTKRLRWKTNRSA